MEKGLNEIKEKTEYRTPVSIFDAIRTPGISSDSNYVSMTSQNLQEEEKSDTRGRDKEDFAQREFLLPAHLIF